METDFFSNDAKKYILLFPLCILIGSVVINILGMDKVNEWGIFTPEFAKKVTMSGAGFISMLKYIVKKRILHFVIIFLVCFSTVKEKLLPVVAGWIGFTFGILLSSLYMQYGINGIWIFIINVMIHTAIYVIAVAGILKLSSKHEKKLLSGGNLLCFALFCMGIMVESLLNWGVFPKIMGFYQ
ncbi:MAG: hypothetical protein ACI4EN_06400 [Butyrivibrio sp.]